MRVCAHAAHAGNEEPGATTRGSGAGSLRGLVSMSALLLALDVFLRLSSVFSAAWWRKRRRRRREGVRGMNTDHRGPVRVGVGGDPSWTVVARSRF